VTSRTDIAGYVDSRATGRCEYCRMHQALQGATFHVEHIIPQSRGGHTQLDNLAWACPSCNLHKSNRVENIDPETTELVPLFNPRIDNWNAHFRWDGYRVVGQTPIGRATVTVLDLNHPRRIQIRTAEAVFALFPPVDISE
jgi:HNH endonuclease